jgi:micrococcal nuclease
MLPWRALLSPILIVLSTLALPGEGGCVRARAQSRQQLMGNRAAAPACELLPGGETAVLGIAGPQTLRLADGRFIRLAEILVPAAAPAGFDPSAAAAAYLRQTALGRKVEVRFGGTQRDRYGVYTGHIYVAGESPLWLQEGLVNSGFATVYPQADNHACTRQLLPFEEAARKEKRGHWGLAYFKVFDAGDSRAILNLVQTYQIVEGTVDRASESGGRLTLHFGSEPRFGFTATLEPAVKRQFSSQQSPDDWVKLRLRIRGWIDRKRGPAMPVSLAEQIEFLPQAVDTPRTARLGIQ